jgi:hypothetical protein
MEDLRTLHRRFEEEIRWRMELYGIGYDDAVKLASGRWRELPPGVRERIKKTGKKIKEEAEQEAALEGEEW